MGDNRASSDRRGRRGRMVEVVVEGGGNAVFAAAVSAAGADVRFNTRFTPGALRFA